MKVNHHFLAWLAAIVLGAAVGAYCIRERTVHPLGMCVDRSGCVYIAAEMRPTLVFPGRWWLVLKKLDSSGRTLWTSRLRSGRDPLWNLERLSPLMALNARGDIFLVARTNRYDTLLLKFDSKGRHDWTRSLPLHNSEVALIIDRERVSVASGTLLTTVGSNGRILANAQVMAAPYAMLIGTNGDGAFLYQIGAKEIAVVDPLGHVLKSIPSRVSELATGAFGAPGLCSREGFSVTGFDPAGSFAWSWPFVRDTTKILYRIVEDSAGDAIVCFGVHSPTRMVKVAAGGKPAWNLDLTTHAVFSVVTDCRNNIYLTWEGDRRIIVRKYSPNKELLWQQRPFPLTLPAFWLASASRHRPQSSPKN